jgi:hypothetical protein
MHKTAIRSVVAAGMVLAAGIALTACSSSTPSSGSSATAAIGTDLSKVCPATITVQTDWNPEADHGQLYEMVGPNPTVDAQKKTVTGPLYSGGKPTGVKIQVRAGGPAIGYQTVSSELYKDKSIYLAYISTDEAVQFSDKLPTTAVMAENDKSPQMIMWDPATYPKVKTISELAKSLKPGGTVRYFAGAAYMAYLNGAGILPASETDGSYDGTPVKFAADKGISGQQGFATAEPYIYGNEVTAWDKPVDFQLIADNGYPIYPEALSVRTGDLSKDSACLKKLVPVLQQADVDYFKSPAAANKLIVDLVTQYNNGWVYDANVANYAVKEMKKLKIATDGSDGYVGDLDSTRVAKVIKIDTPIFTATGDTPKAGLTADDLFTNKFLDKSISLGF